ncbi:sensor histidine kinase [Paenibacillus sp. WST5]|uniref:histidine kinase n=2 Tax=Paenibacillus sedimenti TaxID=2770274 RepID=A0A926QIW3_9BACL|nr:sensor histidine kinase [Paenibacillus sedimenti]
MRIVVFVLCLSILVLFIASIPAFFKEVKDHCALQGCEAYYIPPPAPGWLETNGISPVQFAVGYELIYILFGLSYMIAGAIIFYKKSNEMLGLLGSLMLFILGCTFTPITFAVSGYHPIIQFSIRILEATGFSAFIFFFFLFPTGRFVPKWTLILAILLSVIRAPGFIAPDTVFDLQNISEILFFAWFFIWTASLVAIQWYRYKKEMGPLERQQTKWVVYGLSLALSGLIGLTVVFIIWEPKLNNDPFLMYALEIGIHLSMIIIAITLIMAILRRRLWDIDPLVNRTLLYGILTFCVVGAYVASVWYIGRLLNLQHHLFVSLVATGIVAVMFAPVKEKVQRWINRLMYGEKDNPYSVLTKLGKKLEEPLPPEEVLLVVVRTIREALRLPYGYLAFQQDGEVWMTIKDGKPQPECEEHFIVHQGEVLGSLFLAPRAIGEPFTPSDRSFIETLIRQAGAVVKGVKVSLELKVLAADLQESRERLVLAREEERRRLRSNLHDDLAPRLASLALTAAAAEELLVTDKQATKAILTELRSTIRSTVAEIRSMVHELRPPALDELGIVGAIKERMNDVSSPIQRVQKWGGLPDLQFHLNVPAELPALPAAVEVAAYRIVTEAIVNVVRHSGASICSVSLMIDEPAGMLNLEVLDNGTGFGSKTRQDKVGGIGLQSMRERAEELGGSCKIEKGSQGGTRLIALLPVNTQTEEKP